MSQENEPLNCGYRGARFPVLRDAAGRPVRESFFAARLRLGLEETSHMKGVIYPCERCYDKKSAIMDNRTHVYWCLTCALESLDNGRPLVDFTDLDATQAPLYRERLRAYRP